MTWEMLSGKGRLLLLSTQVQWRQLIGARRQKRIDGIAIEGPPTFLYDSSARLPIEETGNGGTDEISPAADLNDESYQKYKI